MKVSFIPKKKIIIIIITKSNKTKNKTKTITRTLFSPHFYKPFLLCGNFEQHGKLCTSTTTGIIRRRSGRLRPNQHDHIISPKRHDTPQQLRATSGAREADRELVGEAEINEHDGLAGNEGAFGWFGRGTEEST